MPSGARGRCGRGSANVWRPCSARSFELWRALYRCEGTIGCISYSEQRRRPLAASPVAAYRWMHMLQPEIDMGKYLIGWVLGVPAIVLVVAYFFFR